MFFCWWSGFWKCLTSLENKGTKKHWRHHKTSKKLKNSASVSSLEVSRSSYFLSTKLHSPHISQRVWFGRMCRSVFLPKDDRFLTRWQDVNVNGFPLGWAAMSFSRLVERKRFLRGTVLRAPRDECNLFQFYSGEGRHLYSSAAEN